jgi:hypothetical protein
MYRLAWGNGPLDPNVNQVPNTIIYAAPQYVTGMPYLHVRVNHAAPSSGYPDEDAWTWFCRYRDQKRAHPLEVRGIAVDEVRTNQEQMPILLQKMADVWWWCDSIALQRPDWVIALCPGQPVALDYVIQRVTAGYGGRSYWLPECFVGTYKALDGEADYGEGNAKALVDAMVRNGVHGRAIYCLNHSHYGGAVPCYYNAYGTSQATRNQTIYDINRRLVRYATAPGEPFGFAVWTSGYSSLLSRQDTNEHLSAVGA